jgi:hypothetical protein
MNGFPSSIPNFIQTNRRHSFIKKTYLAGVSIGNKGGWKGTIDAEKLIKDIYSDRLISTRKTPKL